MPTRDTAWPAGTPCWVDYGAADVEAAKTFYSQVLGWTYSGGEPEYGGYLTCEADGLAAAGMGPQQDPNDPPRWTTYFAVTDAAASATSVTAAGGTVIEPPMEIGPMGTMVIAADPEGNPFGLWQSGVHTGARIYNEPGSLVWNEAAAEDVEAAKAFYGAVFGFDYNDVDELSGYSTFSAGEQLLGGLGGHQPGLPKGWGTCFAVGSTDAAVAAVERGGGKVILAPQDTSFGRYALVADPWGATFSVMQQLEG